MISFQLLVTYLLNTHCATYLKKIFIPFEMNDNDHSTHLCDVDPDLNYFTSTNNCDVKCNYYLENSFNAEVLKFDGPSTSF